jgi:hypothetical protein
MKSRGHRAVLLRWIVIGGKEGANDANPLLASPRFRLLDSQLARLRAVQKTPAQNSKAAEREPRPIHVLSKDAR